MELFPSTGLNMKLKLLKYSFMTFMVIALICGIVYEEQQLTKNNIEFKTYEDNRQKGTLHLHTKVYSKLIF